MRIVLITQNEPFYLAENIDFLIASLPKNCSIVACVLDKASPFGSRNSLVAKATKTVKTFGIGFFGAYVAKYFVRILSKKANLRTVLSNAKIPVLDLEGSINSDSFIENISSYRPDLLISILGSQIFKAPLLSIATFGCINLHSSLLPKYRGLMPSFWVLKNEEEYTGVSVFFVDEGIDSGDILIQKKIWIGDKSQQELIKVTKRIGIEAVVEAVEAIRSSKVSLIKNDDKEMSYFSFPKREDVAVFRSRGKKFW